MIDVVFTCSSSCHVHVLVHVFHPAHEAAAQSISVRQDPRSEEPHVRGAALELVHVFHPPLEADVLSSARSIAEQETPRSQEHRARSLSGQHEHEHEHEHEYVARERSEAQ